MKTFYRHCKLEKPSPDGKGKVERHSWTEEKLAVVGKRLKMEEEDKTWTDGWEVVFASQQKVDEKYVESARHAHTKQRKASDI